MHYRTLISRQSWLGLSLLTCSASFLSGCSVPIIGDLPTLPQDAAAVEEFPEAAAEVQTIPLATSGKSSDKGGLIAADVDGDRQRDILVTQPRSIAAYSPTKGLLWEHSPDHLWLTENAESKGLPGLHGPGIQAGDIDQDGRSEVLYLSEDNRLTVLSGESGEVKYEVELPPIESMHDRWEHAIIADFTGEGDRQILLQASQGTNANNNYFRDNIQAAFEIDDLLGSGPSAEPMWIYEDFISLSHGSAKAIDLDGDGRDEVVGVTVLGPDGQKRYTPDFENRSFPHADSIAVDDIDPDRPGLEVVIPEEMGELRVILFDENGTLWTSDHRNRAEDKDGDKVAIGDFDPDRPGLELWFRGDRSRHFTVLDAKGELIGSYRFRERRPDSWTEKGFEVINRIRWTGDERDFIVAKERHEAGDVGIFDALSGQLIAQFPSQTERLYVADVVGDWREEIIVLESDALKIIQNQQPNPNPDRPRLWEENPYRRQKMTWNYYSP